MARTAEDIAWLKSTFHPMPRPALPDDCVEYSLYLISAELDTADDLERRSQLREVQKCANELQKEYLTDYIWQRQGFTLELTKENGEVCMPSDEAAENDLTASPARSFLRGRTEYGDSIEDEWVVVWLLRELTKKFPMLWVKVSDNDGEFLLVEAANSLPGWLEPETAENRVWINNGQIKIVEQGKGNKLSLDEAQRIILQNGKRITETPNIQKEAFYRLRNYPGQIRENMHSTLMTVPRKVAYLLKQKPAYISPAVEAFYLRDPIALKALRQKDKPMVFEPADTVTISVKLPRVAYAQVKFQGFTPPAVFLSSKPSPDTKEYDKAYAISETGMKVTCGFEMLIHDPNQQDKQVVREIKMLLEDLETGDDNLPTDDEIAQWPKHEDSEAWLDIDFSDLEQELGGSKDKGESKNKSKDNNNPEFNDRATQENLQRIVKQFETFLDADEDELGEAYSTDEELNSDDDLEDEDDGDDKADSFVEEDFNKIMQEMMGMPPEVMKEVMHGDLPVRPKPSTSGPSGTGALPTRNKPEPAMSGRIIEELDDVEPSEENARSSSAPTSAKAQSTTPAFDNIEASARNWIIEGLGSIESTGGRPQLDGMQRLMSKMQGKLRQGGVFDEINKLQQGMSKRQAKPRGKQKAKISDFDEKSSKDESSQPTAHKGFPQPANSLHFNSAARLIDGSKNIYALDFHADSENENDDILHYASNSDDDGDLNKLAIDVNGQAITIMNEININGVAQKQKSLALETARDRRPPTQTAMVPKPAVERSLTTTMGDRGIRPKDIEDFEDGESETDEQSEESCGLGSFLRCIATEADDGCLEIDHMSDVEDGRFGVDANDLNVPREEVLEGPVDSGSDNPNEHRCDMPTAMVKDDHDSWSMKTGDGTGEGGEGVKDEFTRKETRGEENDIDRAGSRATEDLPATSAASHVHSLQVHKDVGEEVDSDSTASPWEVV